MVDSPFFLAVGAFMTSSGFGGLAALGAAVVAYRGIGRRIEADRDMARERVADERAAAQRKVESDRNAADLADLRSRWWEALLWIQDHHGRLPDAGFLEVMDELDTMLSEPAPGQPPLPDGKPMGTKAMSVMLEAVLDAIVAERGSTP